ncbi:hypothetical protein RZN08_12140 [Bacillus paralicheniformis]|nr:hypothetical protein [Bacillus paralicheniformis]MCM3422360.1 hypothetical protein [Bacillus paralicheniformis]WOH93371.1 hypothetical protein RZN08_12140 [Bacillus paralicheniformis]
MLNNWYCFIRQNNIQNATKLREALQH